jgi:hypothetical protein
MADEGKLRECTYFLVRYVPDVGREEFLNIGLLLHSPEEQYMDCLFTDEFRRLKRFHPRADTKLLRELQGYFEQQIQEHEDDFGSYIRGMQESFSNLIQLAPARTCLAGEPQSQMLELFERYVGKRPAGLPAQDTRMRIRQRLNEAFRRLGILDHPLFEKRIPLEKWTQEGDTFYFDYGYRPRQIATHKANTHLKLIHALSLRRDVKIARGLASAIRSIRQKEPAEVTAVVEGLPAPGDETASRSRHILKEASIRLQPLAQLGSYAKAVRSELLLQKLQGA